MNFVLSLKQLFSNNRRNMQKYSQEDLKKRLTPLQYRVTQENGTEPPYQSDILIT